MVFGAGIPPMLCLPLPCWSPLPALACYLLLVSRRVLTPTTQSPSCVCQTCVGCACLSGWLRCVHGWVGGDSGSDLGAAAGWLSTASSCTPAAAWLGGRLRACLLRFLPTLCRLLCD
jgi:hypothetical protein